MKRLIGHVLVYLPLAFLVVTLAILNPWPSPWIALWLPVACLLGAGVGLGIVFLEETSSFLLLGQQEEANRLAQTALKEISRPLPCPCKEALQRSWEEELLR